MVFLLQFTFRTLEAKLAPVNLHPVSVHTGHQWYGGKGKAGGRDRGRGERGREEGEEEEREGKKEEEMFSSLLVFGLASLQITENFVIALRRNLRKVFCTFSCR